MISTETRTVQIAKYRKASKPVEAWQWNGQPEAEWPEWIGPVKIAFKLGTCEHGWWFIRQPNADRALAVTQKDFERDYIVDQSQRIETLEKALREILPLAVNDSPGGCDGKTPGCPNCEAIKNARAALSPPSDNSDAQAGSMK